MDMRNLSIIVLSKNMENLKVCIPAIRKCGEKANVIIVDDGVGWNGAVSHDWEPFTIIKGEKPFIFSRNCNLGIECAKDDDIILLNDDAILESDEGFTHLQAVSERHPEYGCIGATTNVTGVIDQRRRKDGGLRRLKEIAFICVFIPRRTIERIGLLDERYCIDYGCEDKDYCWMIRKAGLLVGVDDRVFVDHGSLRSAYRGNPRQPRSFAKNLELFRKKSGEI